MKQLYTIILFSLLLTACSGTRGLSRPDITVPEDYAAGVDSDSACIADLGWMEFYSDSTLCGYIRLTLSNNKDLQAAAARIEEMRQIYGIEKVNVLPDLSFNIYANNETNNYSGTGTTRDPEIGLKASVAWEINLWGSFDWARKRARSNYQATVEDFRALQLSLIAMTADTYYRMVALENELRIVDQTVESRKESLRMAKIRFEGGLTSETVYQQAMYEYSSAAAKQPDLRRRLHTTRNALTVLMGLNPQDSLTSGIKRLAPIESSSLPVGVPSTLLQRRPDVRSAELKLAAAMANVGYNYADCFPTLKFGFTPGFENDELSRFLKSPFTYIVGSISGPIFNFGKNRRKYKASIAAYDQSRYQYEKAVIQAFTEVNTAIGAYKEAHQSYILKNELRIAAAKYIHLAQLQYRAGSLNYIDVLDAQRRYFDAQIDVNNAIRDEYIAMIGLYKALGGGWEIPPVH